MFAGLFANQADHKLLQVMLVPTWSPYFIAGMALYLIHRFGPSLLLWGYVAVSYLMALRWGAWRAETVFRGADEMVVAGVITAIFGVMILVATGRLSRVRWRGLTTLGALTYPLYLVHSQLALPLLDALYPAVDRWTALAVVVTASLLSAHAVHRLIERPAAAWMRPRLRASLAAASPRPEATEAAVRLNGDRSREPVPATQARPRPCRPRTGRRRAGPARPLTGRGGGRAGRRRRALKEKNVPSKKYVLREGRGRARPDTLPGPPRLGPTFRDQLAAASAPCGAGTSSCGRSSSV